MVGEKGKEQTKERRKVSLNYEKRPVLFHNTLDFTLLSLRKAVTLSPPAHRDVEVDLSSIFRDRHSHSMLKRL